MIDRKGLMRRRFTQTLGSRFPSTDTADVGSQAGGADENASVLFQPVTDAFHALSAFQRRSDLRPERTYLRGLGIGSFAAPSCKAEPGFGGPVPAVFEVF